MVFSAAQNRCENDLAGNTFWRSRLAEPRTADAVEATYSVVKSICEYVDLVALLSVLSAHFAFQMKCLIPFQKAFSIKHLFVSHICTYIEFANNGDRHGWIGAENVAGNNQAYQWLSDSAIVSPDLMAENQIDATSPGWRLYVYYETSTGRRIGDGPANEVLPPLCEAICKGLPSLLMSLRLEGAFFLILVSSTRLTHILPISFRVRSLSLILVN